MQFDRAHVHGGVLNHVINRSVVLDLLRKRHKEHLTCRAGSILIFRVLRYTHDLVIAGVALFILAKMLSDGVLLRKILAHEGLIHHRDFL